MYRACLTDGIWTFYLRLNGAHVGRRVYVNSLSVQIGALSVVPKGTTLPGSAVYAGVPGHRLGVKTEHDTCRWSLEMSPTI
jgi:hypothetical protein